MAEAQTTPSCPICGTATEYVNGKYHSGPRKLSINRNKTWRMQCKHQACQQSGSAGKFQFNPDPPSQLAVPGPPAAQPAAPEPPAAEEAERLAAEQEAASVAAKEAAKKAAAEEEAARVAAAEEAEAAALKATEEEAAPVAAPPAAHLAGVLPYIPDQRLAKTLPTGDFEGIDSFLLARTDTWHPTRWHHAPRARATLEGALPSNGTPRRTERSRCNSPHELLWRRTVSRPLQQSMARGRWSS